MVQRIEIDLSDYERLCECIRTVIDKYRGKDTPLVEYLEEVLLEVDGHVENERFGADIATEIDAIMAYVGGNHGQGEVTRGSKES